MNKIVIEVKSAIWQKVFIALIALFFVVFGIACWVSLFQFAVQTPRPDFWLATIVGFCFMGLFLIAVGFCLWWPVMRYCIRADETGIFQTNGFFHQCARWTDVTYYYMTQNHRYYQDRHLHVEPVLFNEKNEIIFHGYAHILVSTAKIIEQRNELWQFVEEQLQGKKVDAPSVEPTPAALAWKSLEVNWSDKSWMWKIGRCVALVIYALFWFGVLMVPLFYVVSHNLTVPGYYALLFPLTLLGPVVPHLIWLQFKKRKIAKEMES